MRARTVTAVLAALLLAGCGISGNFRHDPGYAAFGPPGPLSGEEEFGVSLGPLPLTLARLFLDDEPEVASILKELRAVRVYVYEEALDAERVERHLHGVVTGLVDDGWVRIAAIRDGEDRVSVLVRPGDGGANHGVAVVVQDRSEVVLVNLIGNVRLDLLGQYMAELDVHTPRIDVTDTWRAAAP